MGYHKSEIKRGVFGEVSKIQEELDELKDAITQDCKILAACELADLYGAIRAYAKTLNLDMNDLENMCNKTESAFLDGSRKSATVREQWGIFPDSAFSHKSICAHYLFYTEEAANTGYKSLAFAYRTKTHVSKVVE